MRKVMKNDYSGLYVPENVRSELNTDKALKSIGIDEKIKNVSDEELQKQVEFFEDKVNNWEIKPMGTYLIFSKYPASPYENPKSKGGIILKRDVKHDPRSGEDIDIWNERFISVGSVIDVGPDCKTVTPGMDIMYIANSERDLPIDTDGTGDTVLWIIQEQNVLACSSKKINNHEELS